MSSVRSDNDEPLLRIGELARRSGVAPATLRAWERRYGVVAPIRSESGYRLYSAADAARVRAMRGLVDAGVAPAQAAERLQAVETPAPGEAAAEAPALGARTRAELLEALLAFDGEAAEAVLDRAFAGFTVDAVIDDLILPVLREIGARWSRGEASVGQEHFATSILRGRLLGQARGWGTGGDGRLALLGCPAGELHDVGLIAFGLSLSRRGWRVTFLGSDVPGEALLDAVERIEPDAVVLFTRDREQIEALAPDLSAVAERASLLLAGPGTDRELDEPRGARVLAGGPVEEAARLAA